METLWSAEVAVKKWKSRPDCSPPPPPPPPTAGPAAGLAINNSESNAAVLNQGVVKPLTSESNTFQRCCNGPASLPDGSGTQSMTSC